MKKFWLLFIILIFPLLLPSTTLAQSDCSAGCYIDHSTGDDTNTVAQANSSSTPWQHAPDMYEWDGTEVGRTDYTPQAADIFYFKMGEVWYEELRPSVSGTSGNRIVYQRKTDWGSGNNPRIDMARPYPGSGQSWTTEDTNCYSSGTDILLDENDSNVTSVDCFYSARNAGGRINWVYPATLCFDAGSPRVGDSSLSSYDTDDVTDGNECGELAAMVSAINTPFFHSNTNNTKFWYHVVSGAPGTIYVGALRFGIHVTSKDYITVDGIDVYGSIGADTLNNTSSANANLIRVDGTSSFFTLQNSNVKHGGPIGLYLSTSGRGLVVDSNTFDDLKTGTYVQSVCSGGGCSSEGDGVIFKNNTVTNIADNIPDKGDNNGFAVGNSSYILVEKNYFEDRGWDQDQAECRVDNAMLLACCSTNEVTFRYNYLKNVGYSAIQCANDNDTAYGNYYIYGNVIDGYMNKTPDWYGTEGVNYSSEYDAIRVGGGASDSEEKGTYVANNTILNGEDGNETCSGDCVISRVVGIGVQYRNFTGDVEVYNNIVIGNNEDYLFFFNPKSVSGTKAVDASDFYDSGSSTKLHLDGVAGKSVANLNDKTYAGGVNNEASDAQLGVGYHITASSPAAIQDGGEDLAGNYQTGLDEDTAWSPLSVVTADWEGYGGTHGMGAFVYGSKDTAGTESGISFTGVDLN